MNLSKFISLFLMIKRIKFLSVFNKYLHILFIQESYF